MNAKKLIAAMAVLTATSAVFAGDIDPFHQEKSFESTKTRAEVQEELSQARADGLVLGASALHYPNGHAAPEIESTKTRAEVKAELAQARANGLVRGASALHYPKGHAASSAQSREEMGEMATATMTQRKTAPGYNLN